MEIGEKIRRIRIERGLTQEELADRAELSKGFISQIERDLTSPSIATLEDILTCLGTDCGEFFCQPDPPPGGVLGGRLFLERRFGQKEPHRMDGPQRPAKRDGTHPADPEEGGDPPYRTIPTRARSSDTLFPEVWKSTSEKRNMPWEKERASISIRTKNITSAHRRGPS